MLTIKKSSFLFRFWLFLQNSLPGAFRNPKLVEERIQTMTLCRFIWDIPANIAFIVCVHMMYGFMGMIFGPLVWTFAIVMTLCAALFGYYPAGGCDRVRKTRQEVNDNVLVSRLFDRILGWAFDPAVFVISDKDSPYRHYSTLTIFGHPIYPVHLIVPALIWWIWTEGSKAYHSSQDFADQVDALGWIGAISAVVAGLIFAIIYFSKSDTGRLLRTYLKAKKDRACPRIKFVDE